MEKLKELLKEVNTTDWIIVGGIVLALVVGVLTFSHFRQTADKQIEATATIGFQVFLRGVTLTTNESPILPNSETFITMGENNFLLSLKEVTGFIDWGFFLFLVFLGPYPG